MNRKSGHTRRVSLCCVLVVLGVSIWCAGCGQSSGPLDSPDAVVVSKADGELIIDGILMEESWEGADVWTLQSADGDVKPEFPTTVRAVFDDTKLYIGIECQDTDAASSVTGRDAPVFSEEHVTIYLDANSDRSTYAIFEIAPTGAVRDAFVVSTPDGSREQVLAEWECMGIRASVNVYGGGPAQGTEDRFWTVEIAIPFEGMLTALSIPPADGDLWLWNVSRVDFTNGRQFSILSTAGTENLRVPATFAPLGFNHK